MSDTRTSQPTRGPEAALAVLTHAVQTGATPGGVLATGVGSSVELLAARGWAETGTDARLMTEGTHFDLASLTKVVVTLPVMLRLLADDVVHLDTKVVDVLPEFGGVPAAGVVDEELGATAPAVPDPVAVTAWRRRVTIEHLLTHTAGLPAHREHWRLLLPSRELHRRLVTEPLEAPPGEQVNYSDIGFLVLGWLAETVTGRRLDDLAARFVTEPLGLAHTAFAPCRAEDVAATEVDDQGRARVRTVHDETAAALGTPSGHAGLFSTAGDLGAYLGCWTDARDTWLPRELRAAAAADRTAGRGGHRGLGWTARHDVYDQLGEAWPETGVFHSGFTGTSLALDPASRRWVVLLTNDVHFGRGRGVINPLRSAIHTALAPVGDV